MVPRANLIMSSLLGMLPTDCRARTKGANSRTSHYLKVILVSCDMARYLLRNGRAIGQSKYHHSSRKIVSILQGKGKNQKATFLSCPTVCPCGLMGCFF
jgi:hypothetical protein